MKGTSAQQYKCEDLQSYNNSFVNHILEVKRKYMEILIVHGYFIHQEQIP